MFSIDHLRESDKEPPPFTPPLPPERVLYICATIPTAPNTPPPHSRPNSPTNWLFRPPPRLLTHSGAGIV